MNTKIKTKDRLGGGIATLIPNKSDVFLGKSNAKMHKVKMIDITDIYQNKDQPRKHFDQKSLLELAESIQVHGLLQPIIVKDIGNNKYEIIAGERRFRACKLADITSLPSIIKTPNSRETLELSIIENVQRSDLNVVEEAQAYQRLINQFGYKHEDIASRVNKSRSHIANLTRLLLLPEKIIKHLANNDITMGHARALINVDQNEELVDIIIDSNLNVRDTEKLVQRYLKSGCIESQENPTIDIANNDIDGNRIRLESTLSEKIGMPVKINNNHKNITIKFKTLDQLELLIKKLTIS
ncbi:ParB/RepB/Spo0J family partition protein [Anaplasmataceae bacterium AB001_6]|nr:ParB/RepB/Spo0J family partition protein [Anaplasmataceae bacterium AB001_6]